MNIVDARGRGCPEPVLMTKRGLKEYDSFEVIVNEHVAKEKISRLLKKSGKKFHVIEENNEFKIIIEK